MLGGPPSLGSPPEVVCPDDLIAKAIPPEQAIELCRTLSQLRADAGRADEPFETIVPLVVPPDLDLLQRLEEQGMTSTSCYPFSYTIGPSSTAAQKRDQMMRFGESVIAKLSS